ncbi:TPA: cytochrome o ubiquinol oxidase subunit I [Candidatus Saccharibacteria bacterium]|nr:cytochrome o ubiquinol oxidase subunit I [Candidatus Saccharibacteria bacterium]HRK40869.1 cytochrome o ubiquinol oxidase subunit I [Candidatus Saccharibacteria bacterium]
MLGMLSFDDLPHDPIMLGGALSIVGGGLAVIILITFLKKWTWLYREWLTSLDPKKIGVMYIIVALVMLLRGLGDAVMLRAHQALASGEAQGFLSSDHFQQVFTAHGTIMIFFVAMGLMFGLINLVLPLQLGARDVAFPFLNSVSFWLFFMGMALINVSLVVGEFAAAGWLSYPPLSGIEYSPGVGVDYWIWALQISGVGSLLSGINFIVTILKMRAPGMKLMDMPIFAWSVFGAMLLVIFAFPILTATLGMLSLDRLLGMHFFTSDMGGNPMMYINLIWAWGHPEVYILILPAFGIFSEIVATFARKKLFGYTSMVAAIMAIAFFSYVVWLHHFFTMGAGANVNAFFGITTMIIAIPTGVKVFNWLFTMYQGRVKFTSPMYWFLGFIVTFTIGGMTGMLHAVPAIDFQMHNSLFLVAHFHNMIIGGVVFGFMAGLTYWFPKIFGFTLHEGLGKAAAWCWIIGFVGAFGPLYILGIMGATRRLDHYDASLGWQGLFIVAGIGLMIMMLGAGLQALQLLVSIIQRKKNRDATGDPWNGRTLEWSVPSPAPSYNFAITPVIRGRDAFWDMKHDKNYPKNKFEPFHLPKNSPFGLLIAFAGFLMCFALIWHIWWLLIVGTLALLALLIVRFADEDTEMLITKEVVSREQKGVI